MELLEVKNLTSEADVKKHYRASETAEPSRQKHEEKAEEMKEAQGPGDNVS